MKICAKCGAQMEDGLKFCGVCGTPAGDAVQNAAPAAQQINYGQPQQYNNYQQAPAVPKQPNPLVEKIKKQPMLLAIPAAAFVAVIVLIIVIVNVTKYQKIDAKELFYFEFDGLNKYGTASAELNAYSSSTYKLNDTYLAAAKSLKDLGLDDEDWEDEDLGNGRKVSPYFSTDSKTLESAWTKAKTTKDIVQMRSALLQTGSKGNYLLKAKLDKEKNLKNGDKVKVTVEYDKENLKKNKIKLYNTEFEIEVKNLEEGIDFEPFDSKYMSVKFSGIDGDGTFSVETTSDAPYEVYYDWDYKTGLKNGDKVTVKCSPYDLKTAGDAFYFECDKKYYVIKSKDDLTKEFEVSGLTELKEIDVFDKIKFVYDRGTPFLKIKDIDNDDMDKIVVDNVSYYIEGGDSLKVGDKFKVKAYSYSLKSEGYKIKGEMDADGYVVKEFTVDDKMPSYVTVDNGRDAYNSAEFKDILADQETEIKTKLQGTTAGWLWDATNVSYKGTVDKVDSMVLKDVYVGFTSKNNYNNVSGYVNRLYGLYEIKVKTDDEEESSATLYAIIYIDNVVGADGKFYQNDSWSSSKIYFYGTMNDFNKEVVGKEGYTVTKCAGGSVEEPEKPEKPEETTTTTAKPEEKEEDSKAETEKADKEEKETEKADEEKSDKEEKETEKADEKEPEETEKAS